MEQAIAKELVKRKIIKEDTEVNAWYCAPAFGGGTVDKTGSFTTVSYTHLTLPTSDLV